MKNIIKLYCLLVIVLMSFSFKPANTSWTIVNSSVSLKIKNAGFTVDGTFGIVTGLMIFDPSKNYGNSIDASIDSKSINTKNDTRDGHLRKKEYFDVEAFPKINMKATLFKREKDGSFKGYFKLTIKNKTKDVIVPFRFSENDNNGVFKGEFSINRLDFNVGESSMILSDNVLIAIEVKVKK